LSAVSDPIMVKKFFILYFNRLRSSRGQPRGAEDAEEGEKLQKGRIPSQDVPKCVWDSFTI
jgi:hypothetical protein